MAEKGVLSTNATRQRLGVVPTETSVTLTPADPHEIAPTTVSEPVIVDLGSTKRKKVRALKRGRGELMQEVARVMDEIRASIGEELAGRHLVPVVVLYKVKRKRLSVFTPPRL